MGYDESTMHVYPPSDVIEHELTEDCVCGPRCEAVYGYGGPPGWVYTHHPLDAREFREREAEQAQ